MSKEKFTIEKVKAAKQDAPVTHVDADGNETKLTQYEYKVTVEGDTEAETTADSFDHAVQFLRDRATPLAVEEVSKAKKK